MALANAAHVAAGARRGAIAAELATCDRRERRLLDALVDGDGDAVGESIKGRLREEMARRGVLEAELVSLDAPPLDAEALVQDITRRTKDLRALRRRNRHHTAEVRQVIQGVLGSERFRCEPYDDARGKGYDVKATGDYARLFTVSVALTRLARLRAMALTRSPARPVRRQNSRARSIAPRWEK